MVLFTYSRRAGNRVSKPIEFTGLETYLLSVLSKNRSRILMGLLVFDGRQKNH